jgi:hypothetical protein
MVFRVWFAALLLASIVGYVTTVLTAPAGGNDPFDSPVLLPAITVLTVMCAFAGWAVPRAGPLWGVVVAVPYFGGVLLQVAFDPDAETTFLALGLAILAVLMLAPWLAGTIAGIVARRR